ncbi:MAG: hypothetical protein RM049_27935 [Nostoc sp. DedQUE04]|uniref:hypothetical protein n=1 Tax=Nostoc sp. DedQUE04 TaxID=3075390 RepID=UPI002AD58DB2|nr:hypothetical protein [Nostoc sp. DedQUE04]MDZ8139067.1 hypothetical protein [Nostoc sp. DedQUE04]
MANILKDSFGFSKISKYSGFSPNKDSYIVYCVEFEGRELGYWISGTGEWQDFRDNDTDFENLEKCLEGLYEMYQYDEDYEFRYWVQKVKIKAEMI